MSFQQMWETCILPNTAAFLLCSKIRFVAIYNARAGRKSLQLK